MRPVLSLFAVGLCAQVTSAKILVRISAVQPVKERTGHRTGFANIRQEAAVADGGYPLGVVLTDNRELQEKSTWTRIFDFFNFSVDFGINEWIKVDTDLTITKDGEKILDFKQTVEIGSGGTGSAELEIDGDLLNDDKTDLCDTCAANAVAGDCVSGACSGYNKDETNENIGGSVSGDPHMVGLLGQKIDWAGVDGAWYCLLSDGPKFHVNVRLSAPMPEEFPDRQLISAVSVLSDDGLHSLVVEVKNPYSTHTEGCPDSSSMPCLADGGLRVLVNGKESAAMQTPTENTRLVDSADIVFSAANLPAECRPFGGDRIWAAHFADMMTNQRSLRINSVSFPQWILQPETLAAPTWCAKFLEEGGSAGLLATRSEHATIRVETPVTGVRINVGVNYQDLEIAPDGTVLVPELDFWQTDLGFDGLQWSGNVAGLLGDTSRFVLDSEGVPVTSGRGALHGPVESYRVAGPFAREYENVHG